MAGERPLPVSEYPDDFQLLSWVVDPDGLGLEVPLVIADRDLVLDKLTVRLEGDQSDTLALITFKKADSGTGLSAGTNVATQSGGASVDLAAMTVDTNYEFTLPETANRIDAGQAFGMVLVGGTPSNTGPLVITARFRSRIL